MFSPQPIGHFPTEICGFLCTPLPCLSGGPFFNFPICHCRLFEKKTEYHPEHSSATHTHGAFATPRMSRLGFVVIRPLLILVIKGEYVPLICPETSTQNMGLSLMKDQEIIQKFCVQERMTDVEGKHCKKGVDDWDIIGQCTVSLMTVAAVVKQEEVDKYPTSRLVLPFMNSSMRNLSEDTPIEETHSLIHIHFPLCLTDSYTTDDRLEVLLNLQHLIPCPNLPTIKPC